MKLLKNRIWFFISLALTLSLFTACSKNTEKETFRVMSFNIRYNSPNDGINIWDNRKNLAASVFRDYEIDLAGLQEVTYTQLRDLTQALPEYDFTGVGRDDGRKAGEFSPVFYNKNKLSLLETGTLWLSETPDRVGSTGWDAALPRIFTWAKFSMKEKDQVIFHFNTHFDHVGDTARFESSKLLMEYIERFSEPGSLVILTGDLNYTDNSRGYAYLTSGSNEVLMRDARKIAKRSHTGPLLTFNAFREEGIEPRIIDYIFVNEEATVLKYGILRIKKDSIYISDHYPVWAKISF